MRTFERYHPIVLMLYFLSVLLVCMFVWNPIIQLLALLGGACSCFCLRKPGETAGGIRFYLLLFLLAALTNPLFSHNGVTPLFFMNGNPVTLEALVYGIAIGVMLLAVLLWCRCFAAVMTSDKLLYLFGRILPKMSLVLSMALRFIPMFKRQMRRVSRAQHAMNMYASDRLSDRVRGALRIFTAMLAWSLENALETAASMKARGYGQKGRTSFAPFRFYSHDAVMLVVCALLLGVTLIGVGSGATAFYYYPRISAPDASAPAAAVYIAFGILCFLPFMIEVKERIRWNCCISKI